MAVHVSNRSAAELDRAEAWLGSSQMAGLVREYDWSNTPLGPIADWPQSLKSAVAICLRSPFQMAIYWGPALNCIYNDAEREVLGTLHPRSLGLPARELLRDSWNVLGPRLHAVIERGEGIWSEDQPLVFDRRGRLEVSYFTHSYSPILDDDGNVGGVLLVTQDTTRRVLAERRSDVKRDLIARSVDAPSVIEVCSRSARILAGGGDVPFALIYLLDATGKLATCVAGAGAARRMRTRPVIQLADAPEDDRKHTGDEASELFGLLARTRSTGRLAPARWFAVTRNYRRTPKQAYVAAIVRGASDDLTGFLVAGVRDDLAFDRDYEEFLGIAAVMIGRSVAAARSREAQRQRVTDIATVDSARTALFSNASHELRTPLALILGQLEQLLGERTRLPPAARETLQVAHAAH